MHKTWHKPLHKRKTWKQMSTPCKFIYYMSPLVEHLWDVWMQPLPFPTLLKCLYSCAVSFFLILPLIYPFLVCLFYYAITQFLIERHFDIEFADKYDLLGGIENVVTSRINNPKYLLFVNMYIDRYRTILTAVASTIDYIRMALCLVFC